MKLIEFERQNEQDNLEEQCTIKNCIDCWKVEKRLMVDGYLRPSKKSVKNESDNGYYVKKP